MSVLFILSKAKILFNKSVTKVSFLKEITKVTFKSAVDRVFFSRLVTKVVDKQLFTGTTYPLESYRGGNIAESYDTSMKGGLFYCTVWRASPINS